MGQLTPTLTTTTRNTDMPEARASFKVPTLFVVTRSTDAITARATKSVTAEAGETTTATT